MCSVSLTMGQCFYEGVCCKVRCWRQFQHCFAPDQAPAEWAELGKILLKDRQWKFPKDTQKKRKGVKMKWSHDWFHEVTWLAKRCDLRPWTFWRLNETSLILWCEILPVGRQWQGDTCKRCECVLLYMILHVYTGIALCNRWVIGYFFCFRWIASPSVKPFWSIVLFDMDT